MRGRFPNTQGLVKLLGKERNGTIVNLTSGVALMAFPTTSGYLLSKLVGLRMHVFVTAENPNFTTIAPQYVLETSRMIRSLTSLVRTSPAS